MIPGVRLVVLGKQGAGKGTQCVRLSHHYVVPHVSTGDMLRGEVKSKTPLGVRAQSLMDKGELIPDDMVMEMVRARLSERDTGAAASSSTAAPAPRSRPTSSTRSCTPSGWTSSSTSTCRPIW